jgi:hypothetical protein
MSVFLQISSCDQCPNLMQAPHRTEDWFEIVNEWKCRAADGKRITLHEAFDKPAIPEWCPLRVVEPNSTSASGRA